MGKENVISVSLLTATIKNVLEDGFTDIKLEGEISNFKSHSSGHKYFTLKDDNAAISAVMWRYRPKLNFVPEDGMKVTAKGNVTVYPPQGRYQIDIAEMSPAGRGDLFLAFEAMKKKLEAKGYFEQDRKRPLPRFPQKIGIATSPTGAAIRDLLSTIERRYVAAEIYFRPTLVQGPGAAEDIVKAIAELNDSPAEVIIIGRGGGSLEDLWCFNEEITADAIFNSAKPVVSAVGHETDFTISDFTADVRAATPTGAAELVTYYTSDYILEYLESNGQNLERIMKESIEDIKEFLNEETIDRASRRLQEKINIYSQRIDESGLTLSRIMKHKISGVRTGIDSLERTLKSSDPEAPLRKGFAILKYKNKPINPKTSLLKLKDFEIVRSGETVIAKAIGGKQESLF